MQDNLIQVGFRALRKPNGEFMESTPIYFAATPELLEREEMLAGDLEAIQAKAVYNYIEAKKRIAREQAEEAKKSKGGINIANETMQQKAKE